jgi:hypothetical protein
LDSIIAELEINNGNRSQNRNSGDNSNSKWAWKNFAPKVGKPTKSTGMESNTTGALSTQSGQSTNPKIVR